MTLKRIYALRHAKAATGAADARDFDRPLTAEGQVAAAAVAMHFQAQGWKPDLAVISPARRTVESWGALQAALGNTEIRSIDKLYLAAAGEIFQIIQELPETVRSVLIVGHNPGIQHFCTLLAGHGDQRVREEMELSFPTSALAVLEAEKNWNALGPGTARLLHYLPNF